jgi:5-formaminoimidazole-4-carboxamide-1-beta-D-ribofuranosyl 5'-monophosphate synthetase
MMFDKSFLNQIQIFKSDIQNDIENLSLDSRNQSDITSSDKVNYFSKIILLFLF